MDLERIRRIFPDFNIENFDLFDTVVLLEWGKRADCISGEEQKKLSMTMTGLNDYQIRMEFVNVHSLRFCGNGQISGFYIRDMLERGYEGGSRYEIGDYENGEISFWCSDVIIQEFGKIGR